MQVRNLPRASPYVRCATSIRVIARKDSCFVEAAEVAEQCDLLIDSLDEPALRKVALMKLEGFTNDEIAAKLNCTNWSVQRKTARIRVILAEFVDFESGEA